VKHHDGSNIPCPVISVRLTCITLYRTCFSPILFLEMCKVSPNLICKLDVLSPKHKSLAGACIPWIYSMGLKANLVLVRTKEPFYMKH
jgi:hypothetical protein